MERKHTFNVLVVGDFGVGKTSLACRFCDGVFPDLKATLGIDMKQRSFDHGGKPVMLHIKDTAGQEKFQRTITVSTFRNADGVVFAYDITDKGSFEQVTTHWIEESKRYTTNSNVVLVLAGLKSDMADSRQVDQAVAKKLAEEKGMLFFEASALDDINVDALFFDMAAALLDRKLKELGGNFGQPQQKKNTLDLTTQRQPKKRCGI